MKKNITQLEKIVVLAGREKIEIPEPSTRWKTNLMRSIRLAHTQKEPIAGMGPIAWKWAGVALAAVMILFVISSRYGATEEYLMLQSEIQQSADYLLVQSF